MKPEERERLELMASGDAKWDLSPNDIAAIRAMLDELARLLNMAEAELAALKARTCATCRHATHGDVDLWYLLCARWSSPNPPFSDVMCADILTCGAWDDEGEDEHGS